MSPGFRVGVILSGASTKVAPCQLLEIAENKIREGMFLVIKTRANPDRDILCRVSDIKSFNEFYEIGDIWSEARRVGQKVPESIARRYVICELELLGYLPNMIEVTIPPAPGDDVYLLEETSELFSSIKKLGYSIEFGTIYGYEKTSIPLSIEALPMHVAILGVTGSGKSYTTGYLLEKLSSIGVGDNIVSIPGFIIDANGDYLDYYYAFHNNEFESGYHWIYRYVFPFSRASMSDSKSTNIKIDLNLFDYRELAELIIDYYRTLSGLELATSLLEELFRFISGRGYENLNYLFKSEERFESIVMSSFDELKQSYHHQTIAAAKRAIKIFRNDLDKAGVLVSRSEEATINFDLIDKVTENHELAILDFSVDGATGISIKMKQFIVAYLTILLYKRFVDYKMGKIPTSDGYNEARYALFIIEEAQYYCPNLATYPVGSSVAREYISLIATQGRKFGLSLILVTQRPIFVDPIVMSMINTYFIHRISPEDLNYVKRITGGLPRSIANRLTSLETGVLVVNGQMLPVQFPLLVKIPRRLIEPTIGRTIVSKYLGRRFS